MMTVLLGPCYDQSLEHDDDDGLYSAGTVAAIVILCIVVSLVVGFVAGLCLSSRRQLRCLYARVDHFRRSSVPLPPPTSKRPPPPSDVGRPSPKHAVQNAYDLGPGRRRTSPAAAASPRYDALPTSSSSAPPPRPPKDCNSRHAVVLQPKLNNLYAAAQVDVTPQPPPRRHRASKR